MLWTTRSKVLRVIDGDTLSMRSDLGRNIFHDVEIRLLGVWAPERKEPGGMETADFVARWCHDNAELQGWLLLTTYKNRNDNDVKTFDRWVGTVQTMDGSRTLNLDIQQFVAEHGYGGGIGA